MHSFWMMASNFPYLLPPPSNLSLLISFQLANLDIDFFLSCQTSTRISIASIPGRQLLNLKHQSLQKFHLPIHDLPRQRSLIKQKVAGAWSRSNFPPAELDTMFRNVESIYRVNRSFLKVSLDSVGKGGMKVVQRCGINGIALNMDARDALVEVMTHIATQNHSEPQ